MSRRRNKAQQTPERYLESAVSVVRAPTPEIVEHRPFNPQAGVLSFASWVYAAARINAAAVAQLPLRLYVREGATDIWRTRDVPKRRKDYLVGMHDAKPSRAVRMKSADWGDHWQEVVEAHPVLEVLSNGSPNDVGINNLFLTMVYLQLTGNAYWHPIIGPLDVPVELWQMPPQWTWVIPAEPSSERLVDAYMFGRNRAEWRRFETDEVLHFKSPNPVNLYYGMGWVEAGWNVVQQNDAGHEMDLTGLRNHQRPDYLVVMKSGVAPAAQDRFEQKIRERLRGRGRSGEFLSITGDVDIKPMSWPPKDLRGREEIVEEIAAVSGVPVSMLRANDPNLASARTGYAMWRESTVQYWATMIEEHLNELLLPLFGLDQNDAVLAFDSAVPADEEAMLRRVTALHASGIMRRDEARSEFGLHAEPMDAMPEQADEIEQVEQTDEPQQVEQESVEQAPDGEPRDGSTESVVEINGALLASVVQIAEAVQQRRILRSQGVGILMSMMRVPREEAEAIVGPEPPERTAAAPAPDPPPSPPGDSQKAAKACCGGSHGRVVKQSELWAADIGRWQKDAPDASRAAIASIESALRVQREAATRYIASAGERATASGLLQILTSGDAAAATSNAVMSVVRDIVDRAAREAVQRLPQTIAFELTDETVLRIARERASLTATTMGRTTAERVAEQVAEGIRSGESIQQIASRLQENAAFSPDRARMVARTETANAYNAAQNEVWKEAGVEMEYWAPAAEPCEFCETVAAKYGKDSGGWKVGEVLYRVGDTIVGTQGGVMVLDFEDIYHPALHPNCLCTTIPVTD
jgi:HK97 family phage portal protein